MLPTYFRRDGGGYSEDWVALSAGLHEIHHSALQRPADAARLRDQGSYWPARQQRRRLEANGAQLARELAAWKHRARKAWSGVRMELMLMPPAPGATTTGSRCRCGPN